MSETAFLTDESNLYENTLELDKRSRVGSFEKWQKKKIKEINSVIFFFRIVVFGFRATPSRESIMKTTRQCDRQ